MADQEAMPSKLTHVYKANSTNDFDLGHDTDKLVVREIEAENGKKVLLDEQDSLSHEGQDAEPAEVRKRCLVSHYYSQLLLIMRRYRSLHDSGGPS